jgi:uncharacterized protein YegJ (DUF2314 family)
MPILSRFPLKRNCATGSQWRNNRIIGQLVNAPQRRLDLRAGQRIELHETELYDWTLLLADGSTRGGYTMQVILREE